MGGPFLSRLRAVVVVVVALTALVGTGGCEAIVGDTVPSPVACVGTTPGTCPAGYACLNHVCQQCATPDCITIIDAGPDAAIDTGVDAGVDAGQDTGTDAPAEAAGVGGIGDSCTSNTQCVAGLTCVPSTDLTGLTLTATSVCSKPCCTNADCGGSTYQCYPTTGGNLCVTTRIATTSCGTSCGTACCSDTDCGTGGKTYCALGATPNGTFVPSCQPFTRDTQCFGVPGCSGVNNDPCGADTDCKNGLCSSQQSCIGPVVCCSDSACTGSDSCQWLQATDANNQNPVFRGCQAPAGTTKTGQQCTSTSDCSGSICGQYPGQSQKLCSQPCCVDTDCSSSVSGWQCRPFAIPLSVGTVSLLVCQPPQG